MACPLGEDNESQVEINKENSLDYTKYLQLDKLFSAVNPLSNIHDEHLFIVTHQAYELWFKQILVEIDSIREIFMQPVVEEREMLKINLRLERVNQILAVLVDQIKILETMTPMDFMDFRHVLHSSSGFQSWQFRIIENKLGVKMENRILHNQKQYSTVFKDDIGALVKKSENEPSLFSLLQDWLERTPGMEESNFNFFEEFSKNCWKWFLRERKVADDEEDPAKKKTMLKACASKEEYFGTILNKEKYNMAVKRGEMSLSWKALHGALMICMYREEVVFHQPFQMIHLLMDVDTWIMKWRSNHALLVQRTIGSSMGTGGSSGYRYLRATISDRYKVFNDFFLLSNYLIPREYFPILQRTTRKRLLSHCIGSESSESEDNK